MPESMFCPLGRVDDYEMIINHPEFARVDIPEGMRGLVVCSGDYALGVIVASSPVAATVEN